MPAAAYSKNIPICLIALLVCLSAKADWENELPALYNRARVYASQVTGIELANAPRLVVGKDENVTKLLYDGFEIHPTLDPDRPPPTIVGEFKLVYIGGTVYLGLESFFEYVEESRKAARLNPDRDRDIATLFLSHILIHAIQEQETGIITGAMGYSIQKYSVAVAVIEAQARYFQTQIAQQLGLAHHHAFTIAPYREERDAGEGNQSEIELHRHGGILTRALAAEDPRLLWTALTRLPGDFNSLKKPQQFIAELRATRPRGFEGRGGSLLLDQLEALVARLPREGMQTARLLDREEKLSLTSHLPESAVDFAQAQVAMRTEVRGHKPSADPHKRYLLHRFWDTSVAADFFNADGKGLVVEKSLTWISLPTAGGGGNPCARILVNKGVPSHVFGFGIHLGDRVFSGRSLRGQPYWDPEQIRRLVHALGH